MVDMGMYGWEIFTEVQSTPGCMTFGWMIDFWLGDESEPSYCVPQGDKRKGAARTVSQDDRQLCHKATSGRLVLVLVLSAPSNYKSYPWKGVIIR